jgi:hypothetical protein
MAKAEGWRSMKHETAIERKRRLNRIAVAKYSRTVKGKKNRVARNKRYKKQGGLCYWCHEPMIEQTSNDPMSCSGDEIIPLHAGGKIRPGNVVAAHSKCNSERHPEMNRAPLANNHAARAPARRAKREAAWLQDHPGKTIDDYHHALQLRAAS